MKPGLAKSIKDFVITVILFQPGVIPRLAEDLSKVTFEGLSQANRTLVANLAVEMGFQVYAVAQGEVGKQFKTYLGVTFFEPKTAPAQRGKQFNKFEFSYN